MTGDNSGQYELQLTPPAVGAIRDRLPQAVAGAVIEFMTCTLVERPHRVGKQLRGQLEGIYSARRGTYSVLYEIDDRHRRVVVHGIEHRRDAYREM